MTSLDAMTHGLKAMGYSELCEQTELANLLYMNAHREDWPEIPELRQIERRCELPKEGR